MNTQTATPATPSPLLSQPLQRFLTDVELLAHFQEAGASLPFSITSLRKDRTDGRLGGVPFRRLGGHVVYLADEVFWFISGQPIIQPQRHPAVVALDERKPKKPGAPGRPRKEELVEAQRRGITVQDLRAQRLLSLPEKKGGAQ